MATTYYHYDQVWDARNVGYVGPRFGYAPMPDQYMLAALQRLELEQPNRAPVMAEIDLVSSHSPWAPLPRLVDWSDLGDVSVVHDLAFHDIDVMRYVLGDEVESVFAQTQTAVRTDFDDALMGGGLKMHNPRAKHKCACDDSFSI